MEKKSLSYKTDLQGLGKNKVIFIVVWCNYRSILSFLSTLHFMWENLRVCLWTPGIDHICAKSDRHSPGFTSLEFFGSCDSLTLTSLPALSPSFLHLPRLVKRDLHSESPSCLSLCRPRPKGLATPTPASLPATPAWGFLPSRGHHDGASLEATALIPENPQGHAPSKETLSHQRP